MSPVCGRITLSGVRDSRAMDDSESWRSSFYQASRPMSVTNDSDVEFSLVLVETTNLRIGTFMFDPTLDFFGQEQCTSPINEKQSWALLWIPADLSSSSHEYDTPSSSTSVSTFFTHQSPLTSQPPRRRSNEGRGNRTTGFFRDYMRLTFPR